MGGKKDRKTSPGILSRFLSLSFINDTDFNKSINTPMGWGDWSYLVVSEQYWMLNHQGENSEKSGFWRLWLWYDEYCLCSLGKWGAGAVQAGREQGKSQVPVNGLSHQACEDINSSRPGACASLSQRRNHAASFSLCSAPEGSFPLGLKEIPRASFILAWECPMVACAVLLSHWLWWVLPLGSVCVLVWVRRLVGEVGKATWRF